MSAADPLTTAIADWQRKHRVADGDPMIAALELVRIYLQNARKIDDGPAAPPPTFEDFRATIELLDRRSKNFIHQASDTAGELRRFGQAVERINQSRFLTQLLLVALGVVVGILIGRWL
jgi:hypothetical protein